MEFEAGKLEKAGQPGYILMFTTPRSQRQEFYNDADQLIGARNRHLTTTGWSQWKKEVSENGNYGRSVVADVVCLRRRGARSYYW